MDVCTSRGDLGSQHDGSFLEAKEKGEAALAAGINILGAMTSKPPAMDGIESRSFESFAAAEMSILEVGLVQK